VSDTSAGVYEMTSVPVNGACPLSDRSRVTTSVTSQIISNAAATAAAVVAGSSGSDGLSSGPGAAAATAGGESHAGGTAIAGGGGGAGVTATTEQQLSRMLDKIYETIELNELRLLLQEHKDAVKLEWQQVLSTAVFFFNIFIEMEPFRALDCLRNPMQWHKGLLYSKWTEISFS